MNLPGTVPTSKGAELFRLRRRVHAVPFLWLSIGLLSSCRKPQVQPKPEALPANTVLQDRTFHSAALKADVTYRVIEPTSFKPGQRIRVGYLLHGNGGGFREWSTLSSIGDLAAQGYVLVMPEGHSTYFMNSATNADDRYEDFLTQDLIADAERGLPQSIGRSSRFIVGNSMGGFAAIVVALKHPDLYGFAGALSPPVDFPRRAFTLRRISQSLGIRRIFGPEGSATRFANDPLCWQGKPRRIRRHSCLSRWAIRRVCASRWSASMQFWG